MQGTFQPHMERYRLFNNFDQVTILTQDTQVFNDETGEIKHIPCASSRFKIVRTLLTRTAVLRWLYFSGSSFVWLLRNRTKVNLIISENVDSPTPFLFSTLTKTPLYIHYHYDVATQVSKVNKRELRGSMLLFMERLVFNKAAGVWVTAPSLAAKASAFGAKKITLLPNWVDFNEKQEEKDHETVGSSPSIVFVGRLHPVKRVPLLIRAFAQVRNVFPGAILSIVGDGEERLSLIELSRKLELGDSVHFMGFQNHEKVLEIMNDSDLIVLPSEMEGNPRVLVEAMMLKVPIVATNVPGIRDIVKHGETGYLVSGELPDDLSSAIIYVLGNKQYASKISENAYEFAKQNFSKEQALRRIGEDICSITPCFQMHSSLSDHNALAFHGQ
jgi:glycosyltransferase involved in cell wall biosynthesis